MATVALTIGIDNPVLSAGDDTINAAIANSLNAGDAIDGLGGADVLAVSSAQTVVLGATTLLRIGTITITAGAQSITTHDATVSSGQTLSVGASASAAALSWNGAAETDASFVLVGSGQADSLVGGAGSDTLSGNIGADTLIGGGGNDVFRYGNEAADGDVISGGTGTDTIHVGNYGDFSDVGSISGIEVLSSAAGATAIFSDSFGGSAAVLTGQGGFLFQARATTTLDLSGLDTSGLTAGTSELNIAAADADSAVLIAPTGFSVVMGAKGGNDLLRGGGGHDLITGGSGNDTLSGGAGEDTVSGEAGDDRLFGGADEDRLSGGAGSDLILGGTGGDVLTGGDGVDTLSGGMGDDNLSGGDGDDLLSGGSGDDVILGEAGNDSMRGGSGDDELTGGSGADSQFGGAGADDLDGGLGADLLSGGTGSDTLTGGAGIDTLHGGDGEDFYVVGQGDVIQDWQTTDHLAFIGATGMTGASIQRTGNTLTFDTDGDSTGDLSLVVTSLPADASFSVSSSAGVFYVRYTVPATPVPEGNGGDGSFVVVDSVPQGGVISRAITNSGTVNANAAIVQDTGNNGNLVTANVPGGVSLSVEGPASALGPTAATMTLVSAIESRGPVGPDHMVSVAQDYLSTLSSSSLLDVRTLVPATVSPPAIPLVVSGTLPADGSTQSEAFVIDLTSISEPMVLELHNIEFASIIGTAMVTGGAGANFLVGDDGAQTLSLGVGTDTAAGGGGTDQIYGNQGADILYGNQSADSIFGGQEADTVFGGQDADLIYGNLADDVLYGNMAADIIYGGQGADTLYGGQSDGGIDELIGGLGDDVFHGGTGIDFITTGAGADRVVVDGRDGAEVVVDFDLAGGDRIVVQAPLADGTLAISATELIARAADNVDGDTEINLGAGSYVRLVGVSSNQLTADYFEIL